MLRSNTFSDVIPHRVAMTRHPRHQQEAWERRAMSERLARAWGMRSVPELSPEEALNVFEIGITIHNAYVSSCMPRTPENYLLLCPSFERTHCMFEIALQTVLQNICCNNCR